MGFYRSIPQSESLLAEHTVMINNKIGDIEKKPSVSIINTINLFGLDYSISTFNNQVIIGNQVNNCSNLFSNCILFNQQVIIPNGVYDCSNMFNGCRNFNQPINFDFYDPITLNDLDYTNLRISEKYGNTIPYENIFDNMFNGCSNFDQPITLPKWIRKCTNMFRGCSNFRGPVSFDNTRFPNDGRRLAMSGTWFGGYVFDGTMYDDWPINFYNVFMDYDMGVSFPYFFAGSKFNRSVYAATHLLPNNCYYLFYDCKYLTFLSGNIKLPERIRNCYGMFGNCSRLNYGNFIVRPEVHYERAFVNCNGFLNPSNRLNIYILGNNNQQNYYINGMLNNIGPSNVIVRYNYYLNNKVTNITGSGSIGYYGTANTSTNVRNYWRGYTTTNNYDNLWFCSFNNTFT